VAATKSDAGGAAACTRHHRSQGKTYHSCGQKWQWQDIPAIRPAHGDAPPRGQHVLAQVSRETGRDLNLINQEVNKICTKNISLYTHV